MWVGIHRVLQKIDHSVNDVIGQCLVVVLVYIDVIVVVSHLIVELNLVRAGNSGYNQTAEYALHIIQLLLLSIFVVEILVRIVLRGYNIVVDKWQLFDIFIVIATFLLYVGLSTIFVYKTLACALAFICVLRLWRTLRLYHTIVQSVKLKLEPESQEQILYCGKLVTLAQCRIEQQRKVIARLQQVIVHLQMTTNSTDPVVGNGTSQSSVHEGTNSLEPGDLMYISRLSLEDIHQHPKGINLDRSEQMTPKYCTLENDQHGEGSSVVADICSISSSVNLPDHPTRDDDAAFRSFRSPDTTISIISDTLTQIFLSNMKDLQPNFVDGNVNSFLRVDTVDRYKGVLDFLLAEENIGVVSPIQVQDRGGRESHDHPLTRQYEWSGNKPKKKKDVPKDPIVHMRDPIAHLKDLGGVEFNAEEWTFHPGLYFKDIQHSMLRENPIADHDYDDVSSRTKSDIDSNTVIQRAANPDVQSGDTVVEMIDSIDGRIVEVSSHDSRSLRADSNLDEGSQVSEYESVGSVPTDSRVECIWLHRDDGWSDDSGFNAAWV